MDKLNKRRVYQNKQIEEDLYQFEIGNELGVKLEKNKDMHKQEYQKETLEKLQDKCQGPYQNNKR
ncbi:MAG: hypothetical protein EOM50_04850 [Erysipelotrichia bacterium]|nr:hypothetical protein [Erysipelotrichia bacterium]NCC54101.1 hypothetical protein [Erysipelotrichia bacterium]